MKTRHPLILTSRIAEGDLAFFDHLRKQHFPSDRNFLRAHLTMFHRLPGEYTEEIVRALGAAAQKQAIIHAEVSGLRHLGAGVAFSIESATLRQIRSRLQEAFAPWLGPQDKQNWQPHITVQNKVERANAEHLSRQLTETFHPHPIAIIGLDLWEYLGGPWEHHAFIPFEMKC